MREAELFTQADQIYSEYVSQIGDKWEIISPATPDWTVKQLVNHVTQNNLMVIAALAGTTAPEDGDHLGNDLEAEWVETAERAEAAAAAETDNERSLTTPMGDIPVSNLLMMQTVDRLIHSWDLAHAIKADETIEPGLIQAAYDFILPQAETARAAGLFGAAVAIAPDASLQDKLLALTGRDPGTAHSEPVSGDERAQEIHRS